MARPNSVAVAVALITLFLMTSADLSASGQPSPEIVQLATDVRIESFPELRVARVSYRTFRSKTDFFRSRPGMHGYVILINEDPVIHTAPTEALRAILAHELEHTCWFRAHSRWKWIALVRLLRSSNQANWERETDLRAIRRGFGPGLREYRVWLYSHVPPAAAERKKRIYMRPEEITAAVAQNQP